MQAGGPDAWAAPLAAFIADLESELLHSARSKVGCWTPCRLAMPGAWQRGSKVVQWASPGVARAVRLHTHHPRHCTHPMPCALQEEYGDIGTLDARVQAVTERTLRRPVPTPAPTQQPAAGGSGAQTAPMSKADCQQRIRRQHQWLLWLRHCAKCQLTDQECRLRSCKAGKELWEHILACRAPDCKHPCCTSCKGLLKHYQQCQHASCATCGPVKAWIRQSLAGAAV